MNNWAFATSTTVKYFTEKWFSLVRFAEAWRSCVEELQGKLEQKSGELQKSTNKQGISETPLQMFI